MASSYFPVPVENLIDCFARLPGIGRKTAQRLAFHLLSLPDDDANKFAESILAAKEKVTFCSKCQNLSVGDICPICAASDRDEHTICVVGDPKDVAAIERTGEYHGLYHVLHGVISPMNHVGPDSIRIKELLARIADQDGAIDEIIMATDPDTEGEATALYISRILKPFDIKITRLAYGIPMGGRLEFTDEITLGRALEGRKEL